MHEVRSSNSNIYQFTLDVVDDYLILGYGGGGRDDYDRGFGGRGGYDERDRYGGRRGWEGGKLLLICMVMFAFIFLAVGG